MRLGILHNRRSSGYMRRPLGPAPAGALVREIGEIDELDSALHAFRHAGVGALAIGGGDGTIRETLSRLLEVYPGTPPPIAILPLGNTNLISREFGAWRGADALTRLAAALSSGDLEVVARPLLAVHRKGMRPLRGFILGVGAYAAATRIAQEEVMLRGDEQVAVALLATLRRALAGSEATALRAGVTARLALDGVEAPSGERFLIIVTAAQRRLPLGLNPFWGEGTGSLRWLDVEAPGQRLALAAPFAAFGLPLGWMHRAGYRSGRASRIEIVLSGPFTLDGELFGMGEAGAMVVEAAREFRFVAPWTERRVPTGHLSTTARPSGDGAGRPPSRIRTE